MSLSRSVALVFLGIALGAGLTIGAYYGVREYAPDLASWYLAKMVGSSPAGEPSSSPLGFQIDPAQIRGIVSDILASDQGKAVVSDLMQGQSREVFEAFLQEALKSPEFRKALGDALEVFLSSPEGKDLLKRIAKEALLP